MALGKWQEGLYRRLEHCVDRKLESADELDWVHRLVLLFPATRGPCVCACFPEFPSNADDANQKLSPTKLTGLPTQLCLQVFQSVRDKAR
jgi:hypothetical protein